MKDIYLDLVAKFLSNEIREEERETLFGWVNESKANQVYFEEMQDLWEKSSAYQPHMEVDVEQAWQKVAPRVLASPQAKVKKLRRVQLWQVAAVFIGVVIASWWMWQNTSAAEMLIVETMTQEKKEITLPDGSRVWLNENTQIEYAEDFEPRIVQLKGEAFFDVVHLEQNQAFSIKSAGTLTQVLGTSFNVRAYPEEDQIEVTVETGKVAFVKEDEPSKERILLTKGKSGAFNKKAAKIEEKAFKISNADAWKTTRLNFSDTPLRQVIQDLERYFKIKVEVLDDRHLDCRFKGNYAQPKLEDILGAIEFSMDLQYSKDQNTYLLSGEGCN